MLNALKIDSYIKNTICVLMCMLCTRFTYAQTSKLIEAQELAKEKKFAQAILLLDQAIYHDETKADPFAWYLRAASYNQYYKQVGDYSKSKIAFLDTCVSSALKSNSLNPETDVKTENNKLIDNVSKKFHSFSVKLLQDSLNSSKAEFFYQKHKTVYRVLNPNHNFKESDIEFYSAMSSIFTDLFIKSNFLKSKYGEVAKSACFVLLEIDPKNIKANYNLGIIFYNQAATLMREMDYDTDIANVYIVEENAKKLFKQSEPLMLKVHELNPKDKSALEGLEGIYYALNDNEKMLQYRKKKEALEPKK